MPDVVDLQNPIQGMFGHAAMMSSRRKGTKMSAYDPGPKAVDGFCHGGITVRP